MALDTHNPYYSYFDCPYPFRGIRINPFSPNEKEFSDYLQATAELWHSGSGILIYDISDGHFMSAAQRSRCEKLIKTHRETIQKNWKGFICIYPPFWGGLLFKAYLLANPRPVPWRVVKTQQEALEYGYKLLSREQAEVEAPVRSLSSK